MPLFFQEPQNFLVCEWSVSFFNSKKHPLGRDIKILVRWSYRCLGKEIKCAIFLTKSAYSISIMQPFFKNVVICQTGDIDSMLLLHSVRKAHKYHSLLIKLDMELLLSHWTEELV